MTFHLRATRSLTAWFAMGLLALAAGCGQRNEPSQLIASAKSYMAKKDREAAVIQLKNALQKEPTNGEARYLLGTLLLESGDVLSAEKELRRALEYNYSRDAVVPTLAAAMSGLGQSKQLASEFAETTLNDPDAQATLKNELGYAYLALGQVKEAGASFAAALAVQPGNPRGRIGEARIMATGRDLPGAMKVVEEVIAKFPANPDALELKVALLLAQNDREPAKQTLVQLIEAQPANIQARSALVSMLIDDRSFDKAQTELEAMKKGAPRDIRSRYLEAMLALRKGEPAKAKDSILELVKVAPDFIPGRVLAGAIELQLGQFVTAEDHLRRAVSAAPQSSAARVLLAATYIRQGQPGKAEEVLEPALRLEPGNPRVLQTAGEAALARGDFARASSYYERATAADKENAALRAQLARARFASGDPEQGLKDLEAASAIDAAQYQADIALILAHVSRREFDKALAAAATLEKKQPENPLTYDLKGKVYLLKGDRKGARTSLEKALQLKFDYAPALQALAMIDLADKQPDEARKRYNAVLAKAPGNEGSLLGLAELLGATRAPAKEIAGTLERAVASNPTSPTARLALIAFLSRTGDPKGALAAAQAARTALPNDMRILEVLGLAQLAAGETSPAIATFNTLAGAQPQSPAPLLRLARAQVVAKDYDAAIASLRKAMAMGSDPAAMHRDIASVQLAAGHPEAALKEARSLQAARPKQAIGFVLEGELLAAQKKFAEAASAYSEALKREPGPLFVLRQRALLEAAGKRAEGEAAITRWVRENPKDTVVRLYLAERDLLAKDYKAAVAVYRKILADQPDNAAAMNNLAWALSELKDPSALAYAEKAANLAPNSPEVADTLGWMLVERGDLKRGIEILSNAANAAPNLHAIRMHYAKALIKSGDKGAARTELEQIAQAPGESPLKAEAEALLKQL